MIPRRWWIGGLLFASTVINYVDRQTLAALAPVLKSEYRWTNTDFATVLIAFRVAYTLMQAAGGRLIDLLGTRRGLALSVTFYSGVASLTALASGLTSFRVFRFLLGAGEGPNWPGATKAVAEAFPAKERAWAVALFDSGSSIGGAMAPFLALWIYRAFGWRPVFLLTGLLGFLWVLAWLRVAPRPPAPGAGPPAPATPWLTLLGYRQTWGIVLGRFLLDPYWFFVSEWFALYLASRGFRLEQSILGFWIPFLAADLGNFFGGGLSSWWIARGWSVGRARRAVLAIFGPSMLLLIPAAFSSDYLKLVMLFGWSTFAYACCSTMFLSLPADVFASRAVASVSGLGGFGAGIGTLISTWLIGRVTDQTSFQPVVIAASLIPCLATAVFVLLVRSPGRPDPLLNDF